jgi:hypothetical protein
MVALRDELQPVVDAARQLMAALRKDIEAGRDQAGEKGRELQRLQLYTSVVKRLNRSDVLMPEVNRAKLRGQHVAVRRKEHV